MAPPMPEMVATFAKVPARFWVLVLPAELQRSESPTRWQLESASLLALIAKAVNTPLVISPAMPTPPSTQANGSCQGVLVSITCGGDDGWAGALPTSLWAWADKLGFGREE